MDLCNDSSVFGPWREKKNGVKGSVIPESIHYSVQATFYTIHRQEGYMRPALMSCTYLPIYCFKHGFSSIHPWAIVILLGSSLTFDHSTMRGIHCNPSYPGATPSVISQRSREYFRNLLEGIQIAPMAWIYYWRECSRVSSSGAFFSSNMFEQRNSDFTFSKFSK